MTDDSKRDQRGDLDLSFLARQPARASEIPNLNRPGERTSPTGSDHGFQTAGGSGGEANTLTVSRGIALKGDITTCERLVVEGSIEASLEGAKYLEIGSTGRFSGTARVQDAVIGGRFDGDLTVDKTLRITATGRIEGTVTYGQLEVENGGEVHGSVSVRS